MPQGGAQICSACGYPLPSTGNSTPCKRCGYVEFPNDPQHPVPLQEAELEREANVPVTVTRAAVNQDFPRPSTGVPAPIFQPRHQSTAIPKARLPAQQDGRGLEMSQLSNIGVPGGHSEPPEQCLRCCFLRESQTPGLQAYAKGEQGGLQPPTRNGLQGVQQVPQPNVQNASPAPPQNMYSHDLCRWQPETCHRCCSARVPHPRVEPDRGAAVNAPPVAPMSYQMLGSLESVVLGRNAGGEGGRGGGGNEFFVLDETSGKAERWNLLPAARYSLIPPQGAKEINLQSRSPFALEPVQQQPLNFHAPAQGSIRPAPAPPGMQFPRQLQVPWMTQRADDTSTVFMRLPSSSPSDAAGSQLLRQAAMLGLSQLRDTSPSVFVRVTPPTPAAGNVTQRIALPQTSRTIPPPFTPFGKVALEALQDEGSVSRELQRRSSALLKKYRKHLLRKELLRLLPPLSGSQVGDYHHLRQNQQPEKGVARSSRHSGATRVRDVPRPAAAKENMPQATSQPAATSGRPLSVPEASRSVSASTQTDPNSWRPASPVSPHDLQVEGPGPAPQRVFMQGSLRSILPDSNEVSNRSPRIREDFDSSDSSNGGAAD